MLQSSEIFSLVEAYRRGFDIGHDGRKKVFIPKPCGSQEVTESQRAAGVLLQEFEPLLWEYLRFLQTGIPTDHTSKLASHINGELVRLTMAYMDEEDLMGELRVCLLSFCQKWDGIVQHLDWEVANWIKRVTRDPSSRLPPLTRGTTFYDPSDETFCSLPEEDFTDSLLEDMSAAALMCLIHGLLPEPGKWSDLFTIEECQWIRSLTEGQHESASLDARMIDSVSGKVRQCMDGHYSPTVVYTVAPLF